MIEIVLGGHAYTTRSKLTVFAQLDVARKLGPAFPIVSGLVDKENAGKDKAILTVLALSHLPDASSEWIVKTCLNTVFRVQDGGKLARVTNDAGGLMFDDLAMTDLLTLTIEVLEDNLGDFFRTALASLKAADQASI